MPDERTDPLLAALHDLPREVPPPPALEGETLRALRRAGLLRRRATLVPSLLAATLAIAAFGVGIDAGRRTPPAPPAPTFALMLYGGSTGSDSAAHAVRAAEYGAWAGASHADGVVVGGEALGAPGTAPVRATGGGATAVPRDLPVGFFLVRATDAAAATRLARGCPHLKYGGTIVVLPIAPT